MKNKWAIKRCSPEEGHNFLQPSSNLLPASSTHFAPFLPQMWAVKSGGFKIHRTHISTKLFANFWEVRTLNLQRLPEQVNNEIYQCRQNFPEKRKSLQEKTMTMMVDNTIITTTEEWPKSHLSVSQSIRWRAASPAEASQQPFSWEKALAPLHTLSFSSSTWSWSSAAAKADMNTLIRASQMICTLQIDHVLLLFACRMDCFDIRCCCCCCCRYQATL